MTDNLALHPSPVAEVVYRYEMLLELGWTLLLLLDVYTRAVDVVDVVE